MFNPEAIETKSLAEQLSEIVKNTDFGSDFEVESVVNPEVLAEIKSSEIGGLDYRAIPERKEGMASVFEGLAFDPENLRSQAFVLREKKDRLVVGVITLLIAPKPWVSEQRYWEKSDNGLVVRDCSDISEKIGEGRAMPEFVVIPGWTKVDSRYKTKFALPGFSVIGKTLEQISGQAPTGTYLEMQAAGQLPREDREKIKKIVASHSVGTEVDYSEFGTPDEIKKLQEMFGQNTEGSNSTVKLAKLLGLRRAENCAGNLTLGPVFSKKIT